MRAARQHHLARYKTRRARRGPVEWTGGPYNAIDRLIDYGHNAVEISYELDIERWLIIERMASRARLEAEIEALGFNTPSACRAVNARILPNP